MVDVPSGLRAAVKRCDSQVGGWRRDEPPELEGYREGRNPEAGRESPPEAGKGERLEGRLEAGRGASKRGVPERSVPERRRRTSQSGGGGVPERRRGNVPDR